MLLQALIYILLKSFDISENLPACSHTSGLRNNVIRRRDQLTLFVLNDIRVSIDDHQTLVTVFEPAINIMRIKMNVTTLSSIVLHHTASSSVTLIHTASSSVIMIQICFASSRIILSHPNIVVLRLYFVHCYASNCIIIAWHHMHQYSPFAPCCIIVMHQCAS